MDKEINNISNYNHYINLIERKNLTITGVKKIDSFDDQEFLINSNMGYILVKGEGLDLIKLDTRDGNVTIKGKINSFAYLEEKNTNKENSLIQKLFK